MKISFKYIAGWLLLIALSACSKKDENYKKLVADGEIYYPGVPSNQNYRAGNMRTMLIWNPSPDPKIARYKIFWHNKLDSLIVQATSHNPLDTVKVLIPNLQEGTYNFNVYSIDQDNHVSISTNINGVRVYGPVYLGGLFNRGYNADTSYVPDILRSSVKLKFNTPDSINIKTVINYTDNGGRLNTLTLSPDSSSITLTNFKFGTPVTYQSSYIPQKGAIDTFKVTEVSIYPAISRAGDVTSLFIKNPGNPFLRSDNGGGKWGSPKDWQYTPNVKNQDVGNGGGWSWDYNGCIHVEQNNGNAVVNGKVWQTLTLPAGSYQLDFQTAGYGNGDINANEMVAVGSVLPDIDKLNGNTLAIYQGNQNNLGGKHTLSFTLNQSTTVSIGWVISTTGYMQFTGVALRIL